ncbi:MAG: ATP-binding protein, partial [Planctomycetales bacterium]|nr:ATP-binding protein [Planctomycetales bacterium]
AQSNVEVSSCSDECVRHGHLGPTEVILREGELRQILLNIIRNAIQASPLSGEVTIEISTSKSQVTITVTDQGEGISDEVGAKMFEPFFSTKTGTRQGMGLGLSVSRSLAEAMGGTITISNTNSSGAQVTIVLPRQVASDD